MVYRTLVDSRKEAPTMHRDTKCVSLVMMDAIFSFDAEACVVLSLVVLIAVILALVK